MTSGIHSGKNVSGGLQCKNNPDCSKEKDVGPVPPGDYFMSPNTKPGKEGWWALQSKNWVPNFSGFVCNELGGRCGFNIHLGSFSEGCITFDIGNAAARSDFSDVSSMLSGDYPSNEIFVIPREGWFDPTPRPTTP